jgi:hypothetical protein
MTPHNVATLRVRSESGRNTLIIKMRYEDTIGALRRYIDDHRCDRAGRARVCVCSFVCVRVCGCGWGGGCMFVRVCGCPAS